MPFPQFVPVVPRLRWGVRALVVLTLAACSDAPADGGSSGDESPLVSSGVGQSTTGTAFVPGGCLDEVVLESIWVGQPTNPASQQGYYRYRIRDMSTGALSAAAWQGPLSLDSARLGGLGPISAQTAVYGGTSFRQVAWVGGRAKERGVPVTVTGTMDFSRATPWQGSYTAQDLGFAEGAQVTSHSYAVADPAKDMMMESVWLRTRSRPTRRAAPGLSS